MNEIFKKANIQSSITFTQLSLTMYEVDYLKDKRNQSEVTKSPAPIKEKGEINIKNYAENYLHHNKISPENYIFPKNPTKSFAVAMVIVWISNENHGKIYFFSPSEVELYKTCIDFMILSITYENYFEFIGKIQKNSNFTKEEIILRLEFLRNLFLVNWGISFGKDLQTNIALHEKSRNVNLRTSKTTKAQGVKIKKRRTIVNKLVKEIDPKGHMKKYTIAEAIAQELSKNLPADECVGRDTIAKDLTELGLY